MRKLVLALALLACSPAWAQQAFLGPVPTVQATIALPTSTQSRTKLIAGVAGKFTYITNWHLIPVSGAVVTWTYGTGTNCGTGTTTLDGPDTYGTTLNPDNYGVGEGAILVAPEGVDICLTVTTAAISGSVGYGQF